MTEPFDTSAYETASTDAEALSTSYDAVADQAYIADDSATLEAASTQAAAWDGYSTSMDYVASDPTDTGAWSDAWSDATTASNEAWSNSVDAYIAGDNAAADAWQQASIAADGTADATWNAWDDATAAAPTYETPVYETPVVDTTTYETPAIDTTTYDPGTTTDGTEY